MAPLLPALQRQLKSPAAVLGRLLGWSLLTRQQTSARLQAAAVSHHPAERLLLRPVPNPAREEELVFEEAAITTSSTYVWRYENRDGHARQLRSGGLVLRRHVLDTGFGNSIALKDLPATRKRIAVRASILIAPWSYYWAGYYDYVFFIALKLCRIRHSLTAAELRRAVVCYPLFYTDFERAILQLLGFEPENILDSRKFNVRFDACLLSNTDSWYYANRQDILAYKAAMEANFRPEPRRGTKLYIRRAGRRQLLNEAAVLALLQKLGFEVINDVPRTVAEQFWLYYHAAFIIGPHGASFANIMWCAPGTHLFELFANTYVPSYFRYLAEVVGLRYSAYCCGPPLGNDPAHVAADVRVDLGELERSLSACQ